MENFYLKFNSDNKNIDFGNAISIDDFAEILKSLYSAISAKKSDNIILSQITDNCYQCGFSTSNKIITQRFTDVNSQILEKSNIELTNSQVRYKKSIAKVLKQDWYMEVLNASGDVIVKIPYGFNEKTVDFYYTNKSYEGFITLIGDKHLDPKHLHIYLSDSEDFKIFITEEQHKELANFYRKKKIKVKVRLKKSLHSNRVLSAILVNYRAKSEFDFPQNLDNVDLSDINFVFE